MITLSKLRGTLAREVIQSYCNGFVGMKCVFVDEVMISYDLLNQINVRLRKITGAYELPFDCLKVVFFGDFRLLLPVNAKPLCKALRNMLGGTVVWQSLEYYSLDQVVRQSDTILS